MEFATYSDIEIVGLLGMQKIIKLEIMEQLNEQGRAVIGVYVDQEYGRESFCRNNTGNGIQIKVMQKLIFCGYITEMQDVYKDGLHIYEIKVSSYSKKLDYRVKSRTFQNTSSSYEKIAQQIMESYNSAFVVWKNSGENEIGSPIFQYMETDWEFINRLASTQGQRVITNVYVAQPYLMIDIPCYQYDTEESYRYLEGGFGKNGLHRYHRIECAKDYRIGTMLCINEGVFRVVQKHTQIVQAELRFEYCLVSAEMMMPVEIINTNLVGLQLKGKILEVIEDKVKVQMDIDKNWTGTGAYYFDWKSISSNIMYAMPEKDEYVHVRLADARGKNVSVINCIRQNGDNCIAKSDVACKIMQYEDKNIKLAMDNIAVSSLKNTEIQAALSLIDAEGVLAQVKSQVTISMHKGMKVYSKNGKVKIMTPSKIVIRDSIEGSDAEIAINQTIDCQGKVVQINAEARVDYPIINDAPIEVKNRGMGKLLKKVLAAVAVVAVVAATAALVAAVAVASGGAALAVVGAVAVKTASAVAIGSLIGGGIAAGIGFGVQLYSDSKNGTKRDWKDYLYQGVDNFCTGAIIAAPMATPWALPAQLLGVGICSFTYQGIDNYLDEEYGGDFYDVDSNMLLNAIFDIAFAGVGSLITNGLNKGINRILNMSKSEYKSIAKFLNKFPFIKNKYPTDQANINVLKKIFREPVKKVQKFLSQKWITYLILGGEEGKIGADIPTSLFTDSNVNAIFELIINGVEDKVLSEDYDEDYNNYSRIVCEDNQSMIIDFDENGNLVME